MNFFKNLLVPASVSSPIVMLDLLPVRKGMWAVFGDVLGVVTAVKEDGTAFINHAKPDGTNVMTLNDKDEVVVLSSQVAAGGYRQAFINEIPSARSPGMDALYALGYKPSGEA